MTQHDTTFVEGMLKQAAIIEHEQEKQAYGKRLTALLQRKGKLPTEAKPNVGVSSFPTTKQAEDTFLPYTLLKEQLQSGADSVLSTVEKGLNSARDTYDQAAGRVGDAVSRVEDALFETPMERFIRHTKGNIASFQKSPTGQSLAPILPNLLTGAAGAGIGGLAGAATGKPKDDATGQKGTRERNALIGALLGGTAGLGAPSLTTTHTFGPGA